MNALEIINQLKADHITIALSDNGNLDILGNKEKIRKILPFIRDHKAEIVLQLEQQIPARKIVKINYKDAPKMDGPNFTPKKWKAISPVALEWLREHRQELKQAGCDLATKKWSRS